MSTQPLLSVDHLYKTFGDRPVLKDVHFDVYPRETLVIMGGSGSGKSTILKHMIGALTPTQGAVRYQGRAIHEMDEDELNAYRRKFGMLFQYSALLNSLTVGENIALPVRENTDLVESVIQTMVKIKLEQVGLLGIEGLTPGEISGGMKKRVGLARAIALDPSIVFYDEPSSGLDPIATAAIDELMKNVGRIMGATNVVVSHDMKSAFRIADRMVVVWMGEVIAIGTPEEIRNTGDPRIDQFVNGRPDGPIPLRQSLADYKQNLLG